MSVLMKITILLAVCLIYAMQNSYAVKTGLYYCVPMHAAHQFKQDNGAASELDIDITGTDHMIVISEDSIDISDNRSVDSKLVSIISNDTHGPVLGRTETRLFYMDDLLHYFYGSTDAGNSIVYAEDGMCSEFFH